MKYMISSLLFLFWSPGFGQGATVETTTSLSGNGDNEIVIDLNNLTYTVAERHDHFYSFIGVRALAMVHLAIHDILNTEEPAFERYHFKPDKSEFDQVAAIAEVTRVLLSTAYPDQVDTVGLVCSKWISQVKDPKLQSAGIKIGASAATAYLKLRNHDGHEKQGDYTPMTKPGDYQYTPGWDNWVLRPDFNYARPFTMDTVTQFRSPEPPALTSAAYAVSYNEVKAYGMKNSTARSRDQTNFAHWWAEFGEHGWNRIGRITSKRKGLGLKETARMFALINMYLYDIYLASLESKYFYDTWRPFTAIREGEDDGNPMTAGDPDWEPEMLTPPWPEYPSAHASVAAGEAEIVARVYGTPDISFTMESVTALPDAQSRTYNNLDKAADDCADSRIMNGYHFRFSTEEGKKQGRILAKYILENYLQPLPEQP